MDEDLEKRAEELDREMYGEMPPVIRKFNEGARTQERQFIERQSRQLGESLFTAGTYFNFRDLVISNPEHAELLMNFYEGKGNAKEILEKIYGCGSLHIEPDPAALRAMYTQ